MLQFPCVFPVINIFFSVYREDIGKISVYADRKVGRMKTYSYGLYPRLRD